MSISEDIEGMLDKFVVVQAYATIQAMPTGLNSFYVSVLNNTQKSALQDIQPHIETTETVYSIHAYKDPTIPLSWSKDTAFVVYEVKTELKHTSMKLPASLDEIPPDTRREFGLRLKLDWLQFLDHTVIPEKRRLLYRPKHNKLEIVLSY